jgi:hypothetical protein
MAFAVFCLMLLRYPLLHSPAYTWLSTERVGRIPPVGDGAYRRAMANFIPPTWLLRIDSPIGRLELTSDGKAVTSLAIERDGQLPLDALPLHSHRVLDRAARQLDEYFAGRRRSGTVRRRRAARAA